MEDADRHVYYARSVPTTVTVKIIAPEFFGYPWKIADKKTSFLR
jgi:hypothetical protein